MDIQLLIVSDGTAANTYVFDVDGEELTPDFVRVTGAAKDDQDNIHVVIDLSRIDRRRRPSPDPEFPPPEEE